MQISRQICGYTRLEIRNVIFDGRYKQYTKNKGDNVAWDGLTMCYIELQMHWSITVALWWLEVC